MTRLFHITERTNWEAALGTGWYRMSTRGVSLDEQGFIHCSLPHQLRPVAEYVYGDADDLVVLVIDSERLGARVEYEAPQPGAEKFPHIYGPVPTSAVSEVVPVEHDAEGTHAATRIADCRSSVGVGGGERDPPKAEWA